MFTTGPSPDRTGGGSVDGDYYRHFLRVAVLSIQQGELNIRVQYNAHGV